MTRRAPGENLGATVVFRSMNCEPNGADCNNGQDYELCEYRRTRYHRR